MEIFEKDMATDDLEGISGELSELVDQIDKDKETVIRTTLASKLKNFDSFPLTIPGIDNDKDVKLIMRPKLGGEGEKKRKGEDGVAGGTIDHLTIDLFITPKDSPITPKDLPTRRFTIKPLWSVKINGILISPGKITLNLKKSFISKNMEYNSEKLAKLLIRLLLNPGDSFDKNIGGMPGSEVKEIDLLKDNKTTPTKDANK